MRSAVTEGTQPVPLRRLSVQHPALLCPHLPLHHTHARRTCSAPGPESQDGRWGRIFQVSGSRRESGIKRNNHQKRTPDKKAIVLPPGGCISGRAPSGWDRSCGAVFKPVPPGHLFLLGIRWSVALCLTGWEQGGSLFLKPDPGTGGSCGPPPLHSYILFTISAPHN